MLLLWISNVPFTPRTVHPAAKQTQFVDRFLMLFAKLIEILRSAIQDLLEIRVPSLLLNEQSLLLSGPLFQSCEQRLLLCHQPMALSKVAGKGKGVRHESQISSTSKSKTNNTGRLKHAMNSSEITHSITLGGPTM
jgi:hypothetical protein